MDLLYSRVAKTWRLYNKWSGIGLICFIQILQQKMILEYFNKLIHPRSLAACPWKMVVGRLSTFLLGFGNFSGDPESIHTWRPWKSTKKMVEFSSSKLTEVAGKWTIWRCISLLKKETFQLVMLVYQRVRFSRKPISGFRSPSNFERLKKMIRKLPYVFTVSYIYI